MDVLIKNATKVPKVSKSASDIERLAILRGSLKVDEVLLKPIKTLCRRSEEDTLEAKRYLFLDLQHNNWLVRIRSLFIIDILFFRSIASVLVSVTISVKLLSVGSCSMTQPRRARVVS